MSDKLKPDDDLEELSRLLDEMNAGQQPACDKEETAELLAIADLLRKSGGPVCPPPHILDQTVDRALAGVRAGKFKPSRVWWFSGVLGTAAAVILVVGMNMLPTSPTQIPPVFPPQPAASQQQEPSEPKPASQPPTLVAQAPPDERSNPVAAAPVREMPALAGEAPNPGSPATSATPITPVAPVSPVIPVPPVAASRPADTAGIMAEEGPRTSYSKSAYSSSTATKSLAPVLIPLTLPGEIPDLVVTDQENGVLRQVYHKGTPQEITVTQRLRPAANGKVLLKSQSPALTAAEDKPDAVNVVRLTIADQDVTVEGRQPRQQLLMLAESLTP